MELENERKCVKRHFANSRQLRARAQMREKYHTLSLKKTDVMMGYNQYYNKLTRPYIYKQKDRTDLDNILFDNTI